ncbi:hypothetical protein [Halopseudomonas sp.]|uniref:hypothetical protein n=1 Tax=Halopseudomonas sp. TaxID=2901191 RepID=UPI00311F8544
MMATLAEQLARRVRLAAGPRDNPDMSVQQVVSAMAARIAELEAERKEVREILKAMFPKHVADELAKMTQQGKEGEA